jgi:hypothetical protein
LVELPPPEVELLDLLNFDPASLVELFFRYCSWKAEKKFESWNHPLQVWCVIPSSKGEKIFFWKFFYVENIVEPPPLRSSSSTYWISTQHPWSSFFSNTAAEKLRKILRAKTTPYEYGASFPAQKEKKYFFENFSMSKNWSSSHPLRSSSSTSWISTQHPWSSFFSNTAAGKLRKNLKAETTPCEYGASLPAQLEKKNFFEKISMSKSWSSSHPLRSSSSTYWISTQHPWSSFFSNTAAGKLRKILRAKITPCEYAALFPAQLEKKYFFEIFSMSKI